MPELSAEEILGFTNEATVKVLTQIQNMLSNENIEEAKKYIAEQLKSDAKPVEKKELEIPTFIIKE